MFESFITIIEGSSPAVMLRASLWVYPVVNAGHIMGVALLFGSIVPLDLKLIGLWPKIPLAPLLKVLSSVAAVGVVLTVVCGTLLFITRASTYLASPVFITKMVLVGVGLLNGLILRMVASPQNPPAWVVQGTVSVVVRGAALFSLLLWTTVLVLGRLIGYVH